MMTKVDLIEAQNHFSEILTRLRENSERVVIEQEGQSIAAIISYEELKRFEAWKNARDAELISQNIAEQKLKWDSITKEKAAALKAEFAEEDLAMTEALITDYFSMLQREDQA